MPAPGVCWKWNWRSREAHLSGEGEVTMAIQAVAWDKQMPVVEVYTWAKEELYGFRLD